MISKYIQENEVYYLQKHARDLYQIFEATLSHLSKMIIQVNILILKTHKYNSHYKTSTSISKNSSWKIDVILTM